MKFATKLTILFSVIFLAACAVTIYFVHTLNIEIVEEQMRGRLEEQASYSMDNISRILSERYGEIKVIAADPVVSSRTSPPEKIAEKLKEYLETYEVYASLSFFDLNRIRIADTTRSEVGKQHPGKEYWKDVLEGKELAVGISESEIPGKTVLYLASIVKDKTGSPFGLVVSRTPVDKLYSIVKQAIEIRELKGYSKVDLVDRRGIILYSSYSRKGILRDVTPYWENVNRFLSLGKRINSEKQIRSGKEEIFIYIQEQGYRDFQGAGWILIVRVPIEAAIASAIEFRNKVVIILSVIGVLGSVIIFLFSRTITEPLKKLSSASIEIGKGNLDVKAEIRSKDETGHLATSFNKMVEDLKEYRSRLASSFGELEKKVAERTGELRDVTEQLQIELNERKRAEEELRRLNRTLRTRSACNQALVHATEEANLLHNICQIIVDLGGYRFAWVGFAEKDDMKGVRPVAHAGYEDGYLRAVNMTWADSEQGLSAVGTAIRMGKPCIVKDISTSPAFTPWRDEAIKRSYASVIGLPLVSDTKPFGALDIYASEPDAFDENEVKLLLEMADDLSYGIMALRARIERRQAEEALRQAKEELEDKVATRTAELREANEKLAAWVSELEQRNREITALANLGDLLQACANSQEAYTIITQSAMQFFPSDSGGLFIFSESRSLLEAMAIWGEHPPEERVFSPSECWALRRGRPYMVGDMRTGLLCGHVHKWEDVGGYLCVPMMAQGEALGVLHVLVRRPETYEGWERWLEAKKRLAPSVADHIALTVANLKLRETLRHLSIRDPLTGLFNRRYMEESLERELRRSERRGTSVGIIMLDIDYFKKLNDTYGHEAGDTMLRELGIFLQRHIRGSDIACRYGGEEFTLILTDSTLEVTRQRAEHLREETKQMHVEYHGQFLGVITLSLGIAVFPQHGPTVQGLLQAADAALYRAKAEGRDRVVVML